jgi:hypothetical protein
MSDQITIDEVFDTVDRKVTYEPKQRAFSHARTLFTDQEFGTLIPRPRAKLIAAPVIYEQTLKPANFVIERGFFPDVVPKDPTLKATLHVYGNKSWGGGALHSGFVQEEKLFFEFTSAYETLEEQYMELRDAILCESVPHLLEANSYRGSRTFRNQGGIPPEKWLKRSKFSTDQMFNLISTDFPNLKRSNGKYDSSHIEHLKMKCLATAFAVQESGTEHFYTGQPGCGDFQGNLPYTLFYMCMAFSIVCGDSVQVHLCMPRPEDHQGGADAYESNKNLIHEIIAYFSNPPDGATMQTANETWTHIFKHLQAGSNTSASEPEECKHGKACCAKSCRLAHVKPRDPTICRCDKGWCNKTHPTRNNRSCRNGSMCPLRREDRCEFGHGVINTLPAATSTRVRCYAHRGADAITIDGSPECPIRVNPDAPDHHAHVRGFIHPGDADWQ